jgi:trafficking protein particle complex subunit 13
MQTATTKAILVDVGGPDFALAPGALSENVISHEIKELGQHVLACTVSYRLPSNVRNMPAGSVDPANPNVATFRKFYKFAVSTLRRPLRHILIIIRWIYRLRTRFP